MKRGQRIDPRPGLEVFTNKNGTITIKQIDEGPDEENMVIVHPDDVPLLVTMLERERNAIAEEEDAAAE